MVDYGYLGVAGLFFISSIINGVRWFVIRKDYKGSSFLVVAVQLIAFVFFLTRAL